MLKPILALLLFVTACDRASPQVEPQRKPPLETPKPELHYKTVVYPQA
ncbi:MAG: hypothetical protein HC860_24745 [Alkalinema sp. RU_4_3]|nr:hypothetical protein [Alkalinema sp. RU_4_3]